MQNIRLLIIEDDIDQRELICETLEQHFGVNTVVGVESRAAALTLDLHTFDLILTDYNLPDCNGLELLESVQKLCSTPVIMVTGENVGDIATAATLRGAADYVVKAGDYLFTIPLVIRKNLAAAMMKRENESLRKQLEDKNSQLENSLKLLEQMAATDPLTGLYNRRHFGKVIDQLFAEANRYGKDLSCVMIDLDGYKQLNDHFGHQVGDQLLQVAGRAIGGNMRQMDVAARYGGDEFVLLLPHADADEAESVADRIRKQFAADSARVLQRSDGVTMSIGIGSMLSNRPAHAEALVANADAALYQSKAQGRNRISKAQATLVGRTPR